MDALRLRCVDVTMNGPIRVWDISMRMSASILRSMFTINSNHDRLRIALRIEGVVFYTSYMNSHHMTPIQPRRFAVESQRQEVNGHMYLARIVSRRLRGYMIDWGASLDPFDPFDPTWSVGQFIASMLSGDFHIVLESHPVTYARDAIGMPAHRVGC